MEQRPSYPKWLYHPTKPALIVSDEAERSALGSEWVESPADLKPVAETPPEPLPEPAPALVPDFVFERPTPGASDVATSVKPKKAK